MVGDTICSQETQKVKNMEIGRICVKIAGRDAGKRCVIVDTVNDNQVLIDGETRRRKCNLKHLEPLAQTVEIKKGADHEAVKKALKALGIEIKDTKPKKEKTEKPKKLRKAKPAKSETETPTKKEEAKAEKPQKANNSKKPGPKS